MILVYILSILDTETHVCTAFQHKARNEDPIQLSLYEMILRLDFFNCKNMFKVSKSLRNFTRPYNPKSNTLQFFLIDENYYSQIFLVMNTSKFIWTLLFYVFSVFLNDFSARKEALFSNNKLVRV